MYNHAYKTTKHVPHVAALLNSCYQIIRAPFINLFIIFIIAFVGFVPTCFYVFWQNINVRSSYWNHSAEIILYLQKNTDSQDLTSLLEQLQTNPTIMTTKLITPHEGMQELAKQIEKSEFLLDFKDNPLPHIIRIYPNLTALTPSQLTALITELKQSTLVDTVKTNTEWIEHSQRILLLWQRLAMILFALFSISAIIIIGGIAYLAPRIIAKNTNVPQQVLQYQCFWHGLSGSLLALALTNIIILALRGFALQGPGVKYSLGFILTTVVLVVICSKLMLNNFLKN